jgi:type I restriction enzyme R subunit
MRNIDMDSYRPEIQAALSISLADQNAEIGPVPTSGGGRMPEPELDRVSNIVKAFNEQFGNKLERRRQNTQGHR